MFGNKCWGNCFVLLLWKIVLINCKMLLCKIFDYWQIFRKKLMKFKMQWMKFDVKIWILLLLVIFFFLFKFFFILFWGLLVMGWNCWLIIFFVLFLVIFYLFFLVRVWGFYLIGQIMLLMIFSNNGRLLLVIFKLKLLNCNVIKLS